MLISAKRLRKFWSLQQRCNVDHLHYIPIESCRKSLNVNLYSSKRKNGKKNCDSWERKSEIKADQCKTVLRCTFS